VGVRGEIVTVRGPVPSELEIVAGDHPDSFIVAESVQEFLAIPEKTLIREAVVLQDDGLLLLGKDPVQSAGHSSFAAKVGLGEILPHLTGPVHGFHDRPNGGAPLCFPGAIGTWSIRYYQ
jgi:hypothetical protein